MTERVSLEEAKRLKKAGYPQEKCGKYVNMKGQYRNLVHFECGLYLFAAPCGCELLQQLPFDTEDERYHTQIEYIWGAWHCHIMEKEGQMSKSIHEAIQESLVSALVDLYCWLSKEGWLK